MENKIIIVFYFGVKNMSQEEIFENITYFSKHMEDQKYKDIIYYLIPNHDSNNTKIECINPQIVGSEIYSKVLDTLEEIKNKAKELIIHKLE